MAEEETMNPLLRDMLEISRRADQGNVEKLTQPVPEESPEPEEKEGTEDSGGEVTAEEEGGSGDGSGEGHGKAPGGARPSPGPGKEEMGPASDPDPVQVLEGVERIVGRIARLEGKLESQAVDNREQLFVELSEEIHRAARWEVRDTVMEVLSGPAEAIAGTGHACAILASVARGEGDIGRGLGEASGVLGIVQRYLDRDSVTVRGEAMKLDKVLGTEGRVAARIGAAKQLIGAAQEELRFVPAEQEPARKAAHAAMARLGAAQIEMSTVFGAVGAVDEESLPHVPGVDRGGVPESAELREARAFRLDFYRGQKRQNRTMQIVRYGLVGAVVMVAAVIGRVSPYLDGVFGSVAGALF